jgi:hypothetical protein
MKEQSMPKSLSSQIESKASYMDDFYLSKNINPAFHKIDSGTTVIVFSDSVYSDFGGSVKRIGFQFSNPNIVYRNLKLIVNSASNGQYSRYKVGTTTTRNGVKEVIFDSLGNGIMLSAGWSSIVLKAKVCGNTSNSFNVSIPDGYITYRSVNENPGAVVGLPLSSKGLKIR